MAKRGRPTEYREDMPQRAYELCRDFGLTDVALAKAFGISKKVLNEWKGKYPEFRSSVQKGKDEFDSGKVEATLLKRALGFSKEHVKIFQYLGDPVIVPFREYYPPDVTAIIWWLKNRNPQRWRDRQEIALEHPDLDGFMAALGKVAGEVWGSEGGESHG